MFKIYTRCESVYTKWGFLIMGKVAREIIQAMKEHPEDWVFQGSVVTHKPTGSNWWIRGGFFFFSDDDDNTNRFINRMTLWERWRVWRALKRLRRHQLRTDYGPGYEEGAS